MVSSYTAAKLMKFTDIKNSSTIQGCHYNPETKTLTVKFKSGGTYAYNDCPVSHYDSLCKAESAGKYFAKSVKSSYKWKKL